MTMEVTVGGRTFRATVVSVGHAGAPGSIRVRLEEPGHRGTSEERQLLVHETPHGLMLVDEADGRVIDAAVRAGSPGEWCVQVRGVDMVVASNGGRRAAVGARGAAGAERLTAPMPGRVLRVLVAVGAVVEAGQPVVVIEAMKMENALTAARGGTVREVMVEEGASVEAGRPLMRLD